MEIQHRMSDGASALLVLLVRLYEKVMCALRSRSAHQMVVQVVGSVLVSVADFLHSLGIVVFPSGLYIGTIAGPVLQ